MSATGKGNRSRSNADDALLLALAAGQTLQEAATTAGVSGRTASRRMEDVDFAARVRKLRTQIVVAGVQRLANLSTQAADKLGELLSAKSEMIQLNAARSILDLALKGSQHFICEELEAALDKADKQHVEIMAELQKTRDDIRKEVIREIESRNGNR